MEIKLEKRYPHSRTEDITDAFMRGYQQGKHEVLRKFSGMILDIMTMADRKTEPQYSEDDMYWLSLAEDVANGKMSDAGANQAWLEYINHKTENSSEKPNNFEDLLDWKDRMWAEAVIEPQTERSE